MSREIHDVPSSLVAMIKNNESYIRERQLLIGQRFEQLVELLSQGDTTGSRQLDLAILAKRSLDEAIGLPYYEFEQELQAHPGELVVMKQTWQEPTVRYCMDPGHSVPTRPVSEYLFGVIREAENVDVLGAAGLYSYLETAVILRRDDYQLGEVLAAPFSMLSFVSPLGGWKPSSDPKNYCVGNTEVAEEMTKFRYSICSFASNGEELFSMVCRALGVEYVGDDGQGRLGIPDPNPNAPNPLPIQTD
ncbi:MAG: hypothetical protein AAB669_02145 [Patescibacteria group bacterium]